MRARRHQRGQATVELALGTLVFVVVLLIGIHLAEVGYLSLKVQEAQTFAVWEATGKRVQAHREDGTTDVLPWAATLDSTSGVGPQAQRRYQDFNGLSSVDRSPIISTALTRGTDMAVACAADPRLSFRPSRSASPIYRDEGGTVCTASATLAAINVPTAFLQKEQGGFFRAEPFRRQPLQVCGMGLPVAGACRGGLAVLTNDWGFVGEETKQCRLDCTSSAYRGAVQRLFELGGGGWSQGRAFAEQYAGTPPTDATSFYFSYAGVDSPSGAYTQWVPGEGDHEFQTGGAGTPGGMVYQTSTDAMCFLGRRTGGCP